MKTTTLFFLMFVSALAQAKDTKFLSNLVSFHEKSLEFALDNDPIGILKTNHSLLQPINLREVELRESLPQIKVENLGIVEKLAWSAFIYNKTNPETPFQIINGRMRMSEKKMAKIFPNLTETVYKLALVAKDKSEEMFPYVEENLGIRDAYRHTIWSALMTKHLGPDTAALYLSAHELENGNAKFDINYGGNDGKMDFFNNELGRIVALSLDVQSNKELFLIVKKIVQTGRAAMLDNNDQNISVRKRAFVPTDFKQIIRFKHLSDRPQP
jgi:hypothetical protein